MRCAAAPLRRNLPRGYDCEATDRGTAGLRLGHHEDANDSADESDDDDADDHDNEER